MSAIKELFNSKKFLTSLFASAFALAGLYLGLPIEQVLTIIAPLGGYTVAQGVADIGKERAKIEAGK